VIDEFGKLVHPSKCEVPLMDLVVMIKKKLLLLLAPCCWLRHDILWPGLSSVVGRRLAL
jgi:hypothetical protein